MFLIFVLKFVLGVHHHLLEEDEYSSKNYTIDLKGYNGHFVIGLNGFMDGR